MMMASCTAFAQGSNSNTAKFVEASKEASVRYLRPGDAIDTETSKADAGDSFVWRVACYEIRVPQAGGVQVDLEAYGQRAVLMITPSCRPRVEAFFEAVDNGGARNDLSLVTEITGPRRFVQAWFRGSGKKYRVRLTQMTPEQTAAWREGRRRAEMARQASGGGGLGGILQGALAGASGMVNGGGGMESAIAGAAAGAVAGAAGIDAGSIQGGFKQGASDVNAQNVAMQAQFEQSMARAGAPGYRNSVVATSTSQAASNQSNVSEAASTTRPATGAKIRKPFRFHLIVGLENRPQDTANALCMSNAINESFEGEENGWGDNALRERIFEKYRPSFEEKCRRLRPLQGTTTYAYDQGWNSSGIGVAPNNMYFRVTLP